MLGMLPRRHQITRLEAFSDAVFGFALALLVVSTEPPGSYAELADRMLGGVSFACCFALLVWMWYEHNAFFRRFGLQDGVTILLNSVLLFLVLLYVYPLKFMFDSLFSRWFTRLQPPVPMQLWELANAATIYAAGFIAIFAVFALLYRRALARREELGLTELEAFDARTNIAHHLISAGVGVVSLTIATVGPLELAPIAPTAYVLMGPAHFGYGTVSGKKRRVLEQQLAGDPAADAVVPLA
jgi:uncharacterized membrane protein